MAKVGGYLLVDHRASPGLPEDIARQAGYDPNWTKEGRLFEADTMTCSHCNTPVIKNLLRTRPRAHCQKCNHYICDACDFKSTLPDYNHFPFEKLVDTVLEMAVNNLGSPPNLLK